MTLSGKKTMRNYRDKIKVQEENQSEKEREFTNIMAEMKALKNDCTSKPIQINRPNLTSDAFDKSQYSSVPNMTILHSHSENHKHDFSRGFQYSGGGIIRQHSKDRTSTPYSRSRSPSPNNFPQGQNNLPSTSPSRFQVPQQSGRNVILSQRDPTKRCYGNTLSPSNETFIHKSVSDSNLNDQRIYSDWSFPVNLETQGVNHPSSGNHDVLNIPNVAPSPLQHRRNTEKDMVNITTPILTGRKASEPTNFVYPDILVTFHDQTSQGTKPENCAVEGLSPIPCQMSPVGSPQSPHLQQESPCSSSSQCERNIQEEHADLAAFLDKVNLETRYEESSVYQLHQETSLDFNKETILNEDISEFLENL